MEWNGQCHDVFERRDPMLPGAFQAKKKNGQVYYRSSIHYKGKHISLGSFATEEEAHQAYCLAGEIFEKKESRVEQYPKPCVLSFEKWVVLHNFRDSGFYFKTPIYLQKKYFLYYYSETYVYKFDVDDLFYYSNHKIMKRGGHLFVVDFGVQENILHRYGIRNYGVAGKDFIFVNGDEMDYRYENIEIINRYHGVSRRERNGRVEYVTKIHLNGMIVVGRYPSENEAAIAYNKAAEYLWEQKVEKEFPLNYISDMEKEEYQEIYDGVKIGKKRLNKCLIEYRG